MENQSSKITPNRGGMVYDKEDSEKVQKSLRTWKSIRTSRAPTLDSEMPYWKIQSSCNAL